LNIKNLQNIPSSGTTYAKHIKRCIKAPPGWLWVGVDFASLEDRISALTTRDPEKLKVYMGHVMFDITLNGVVHRIYDNTTISYDGQTYTGEQFYEMYSSGVL
jgi:hypothetical protein